MSNQIDEVKEALNDIKVKVDTAIDEKTKSFQDQLDILFVKTQGGGAIHGTNKPQDLQTAIKGAIKSKENEIKNMDKSVLQIKSVFTSDVTGTHKPHSFKDSVVLRPSQLINVTDLIGKVAIQGGSYSYAVETVSGAPAVQVEGEAKANIDVNFEYKTVDTHFIAGVTEVSRQFLNNYTSLAASIPTILDREYYKKENELYSAALFSAATASTVASGDEVTMLTKEIAALMGNNIEPTAIVLNPSNYTDILLNEKSGAGYNLPKVVMVSENGLMSILGVPVFMATWVAAQSYLVLNGNKIMDAVQEDLNLQIDNSEKFSKNISIFRIEKQSNIVVTAPAELIKGTFAANV